MKEFKTENLFITHPSEIIDTSTKSINKTEEKHIITFRKDIKNISIVNFIGNSAYEMYGDIKGDYISYRPLPSYYNMNEFYVHVTKNDILRLSEYLWHKSFHKKPFTEDIYKYILELKPYYDIDELNKILEQYKNEIINQDIEPVKIFKYEIRRKKEDQFTKYYL
jgi:hypothetical protein